MLNSDRSALVLALTAILISAGLQAGAYRWVDENGVTVYSQTPPPPNVESTRLEGPAPPPTDAAQNELEDLKRQYQAMQDREDIRKEQLVKEQEDDALQQKKDQNCQAAKHNMEILQGPTRSRIQTPDGEFHRITQEEREQHMAEAEKMIEEYCGEQQE